jgi:hypothetical protein
LLGPSVFPMRWMLPLLLLAAASAGRPDEEEEAYRRVAAERDRARAAPSDESLAAFEREAERFLAAHGGGRRADTVWLWRGDFARERDPRAALAAYARSRDPAARERARALAFRHEEPPPLAVEAWSGEPVDVTRPDGKVTLVVFFSVSHPQTAKLLPYLRRLHEAHGGAGLRVVGVLAVVDDHERQRPPALLAWAKEQSAPFALALDRQQPGRRSLTLETYLGNQLPWAVLLDRYGRIAAVRPFAAQGNPAAHAEEELRALLAEPGYDELLGKTLQGGVGGEEALARLGAIRNRATAAALFAVARDGPLRAQAVALLRGLLPEGFLGDDVEAAWRRFQAEASRLRYDFASDRLAYAR